MPATHVPHTRSRSGIRKTRTDLTTTPSEPFRRTTSTKRKRSELERRREAMTLETMLLKKPKFLPRPKFDRRVQTTTAKNDGGRDQMIAKLEVCASLITPALERVSPTLKEQIEELRKFEVFKNFNLQLGTLKILQSDSHLPDDEDDEELLKILLMDDGEEKNKAFHSHFGFKNVEESENGKEKDEEVTVKKEFDTVVIKQEEQ